MMNTVREEILMKKKYERPEAEIVLFRLTECILSSAESSMQEQVTEFIDPNPGGIDDL